MSIFVFIVVATMIRLATLAISIRNEKRLLAEGGVEYDAITSRILAMAHVLFYLAAFGEGLSRLPQFSWVTAVGLAIYGFGICTLFWVIVVLGRFWTVKLIVARDHRLVTNSLFRRIRHPNYYLNILPELIGLALVLQAWITLAVGLPVYLAILVRRIREEEGIMHAQFPDY